MAKRLFRTQYNREPQTSNPGDRFESTYGPKIDENGVIDLVETGKVDTYEEIQAWRESCDIQTILSKYVNGDASALNKNSPLFGDFTDCPTSLSDFYQRLLDAESAFNRLPVETRAQFNHSPSEFFTSIGSDRFNEIMGINSEIGITPVPPVTPTDPVPPVTPEPANA